MQRRLTPNRQQGTVPLSDRLEMEGILIFYLDRMWELVVLVLVMLSEAKHLGIERKIEILHCAALRSE